MVVHLRNSMSDTLKVITKQH